MDMREELGWVSYNMTSRRWVLATMNYNSRLEALNSAKNIVTIPKHPRALMEHLGWLRRRSHHALLATTLLVRLRPSFYFIDCEINVSS
jgi:hypothetical protein